MNTQIETAEIIKSKEVAKLLHVSLSALYLLIAQGKIPFYRTSSDGGHFRFNKKDVLEFYDQMYKPQPSKANESINSFFRLNGSDLLLAQSKIERTKDLYSPNEYKKTTPITKREISISENAEGVVTIVLK